MNRAIFFESLFVHRCTHRLGRGMKAPLKCWWNRQSRREVPYGYSSVNSTFCFNKLCPSMLPILEIKIRNRHSTRAVASSMLSRWKRSPPSTCWHHLSSRSPGYHEPSMWQGHTAGPWSTRGPPGPPGSAVQTVFNPHNEVQQRP